MTLLIVITVGIALLLVWRLIAALVSVVLWASVAPLDPQAGESIEVTKQSEQWTSRVRG